MSDTNIERVVEKSRRFLTQAQSICHESNNRLLLLKVRIQEWQKYRSKLQFVLECISEQTDFLTTILLKRGIGESLIEKEWRSVVLVDLVNEMEHWQKEIQKTVERLDNIKNVLEQQRDTHLGDFISRDTPHALGEKLTEVPVIKKQVENITKQYQHMLSKVQSQVVGTRLTRVNQEFDRKFSDQCEENVKLDEQSTAEADQLEQELADFLKSFTDHFDKCGILLSRSLAPVDSKSLYEIVERDDKDLPAIDSALKEAASDVARFTDDGNALLDKKEGEKADMEAAVMKMMNELRKHEEYILVFEGISKLIRKFKISCMNSIRQTRELLDFYANFEKSYYNLLSEVERRREVAAKMSQVIKSCEDQLAQLNSADIRERQMFLLENGDFLPETIWPHEIGNLSPLYSLDSSVRKI
ncbi:LANO_0G12596g1_1 [Lachancea nothofagi CBS 11611]|uniref:Autophagy-related protein 17 n=1 Tax=Lachancea nothofagi CBS 11611 TaxID=1266666 RepID=A0A1G4KK38_9SACH|nr:LANO_0G12596g1_1 [Lachancea nothofagi CBS 11611]